MPGLRPLDLGEILDAAFRVFGRRWRTLVTAALIIAIPLNLASTGLVLAFAPDQFDVESGENPLAALSDPGQGGALAAVMAARVVDVVASALALAACMRIAAGDLAGRDPGPGVAISFALRRLPATVGVVLVVGIGVGIGVVLLIVPGVWLGTVWGLALPALLFERTGVVRSLSRSRDLVRGRFWPVLGLLVLAFLITLFSAGVIGAIASGLVTAAGADVETAGAAGAFVSGVASTAFAVPVAAAMLLLMYVDQRVRREGLSRAAFGGVLGEPSVERPDAGTPAGPQLPGGWQPPTPHR